MKIDNTSYLVAVMSSCVQIKANTYTNVSKLIKNNYKVIHKKKKYKLQ